MIQSFQKYCGNEKWLCWVYMLDAENGFLLTSNSNPNVPPFLNNESGWFCDGEVPEKLGGTTVKHTSKAAWVQKMIDACEEDSKKIGELIMGVTNLIQKQANAMQTDATASMPASKKCTIHSLLKEQEELKKHVEGIEADDLFTPRTKAAVKAKVNAKCHNLINEVCSMAIDSGDNEAE